MSAWFQRLLNFGKLLAVPSLVYFAINFAFWYDGRSLADAVGGAMHVVASASAVGFTLGLLLMIVGFAGLRLSRKD